MAYSSLRLRAEKRGRELYCAVEFGTLARVFGDVVTLLEQCAAEQESIP